ncbi:MAG TPA: DUF2339 domain-containing protein [Gemmatimonadaceae bacterium]|nr:DUF2339 domain-containing protein [Gemmatimonadaceae bacterium]
MSELERIERLETIVRALHQQVAALRDEVRALRAADIPIPEHPALLPPLPPPVPESRAPNPAPVAPRAPREPFPSPDSRVPSPAPLDLEALLGRYGTIALATLALLTGAGAFLTWAIAHGLLGPAQRVALGALGAAAVGWVGWRLRARGTVRFGNVLLALALALIHLDAWAAGPRLHVLAPALVLVATAGASAALAALALRAREEALFAVGLGGALAAPFVTTNGGGSALLLAGYGWIVIAGGAIALRDRAWRVALGIAGVGCAAYAVALTGMTDAATPWLEHHVAVVFALACAWSAIALAAPGVRGRLALACLWVALLAALAADWGSGRAAGAIVLSLAGTLGALAAERTGSLPAGWRTSAAVLVPLGFLASAVGALSPAGSPAGALVAAGWTALALAAAWLAGGDGAGLHLVTAAMASGAAVILALHGRPEWCIAALAAHAAMWAAATRRTRAPVVLVPVALSLAIASVWAYARLAARPAYQYTPFLGRASAAAIAVLAAWAIAAREARAAARAGDGEGAGAGTGPAPIGASRWLAAAGAVAAFLWVREELVRAFHPDVATFLVIVYYACAGVGAILVGRRRALPGARAAGLALAFYAGIKALVQAWDISAIGLRVGSCVLVGLFIALVSYWYRAPDEPRAAGRAEPASR